jgi:hypothetical protein
MWKLAGWAGGEGASRLEGSQRNAVGSAEAGQLQGWSEVLASARSAKLTPPYGSSG